MDRIKFNGAVIRFFYTNHKGERELRRVKPESLMFTSVEGYYPEPTWLLNCWDEDRKAQRSFDLSKIETDSLEQES